MKKITYIGLCLLFTLLLTGCSYKFIKVENEKDKQIKELQDQINELKDQEVIVTTTSETKSPELSPKVVTPISSSDVKSTAVGESQAIKNDNFNKNLECQKYKTEEEKKYNYKLSVTMFYSPSKNTCVSEVINITNGQLQFRMLSDVFSIHSYVLEQNGNLLYDEKEFGINKSYSEIRSMLEK